MKKKRMFAGIAAVLTLMNSFSSMGFQFTASASDAKLYHCDGFDVSYDVNGSWNGGFNAMLTVTNTGDKTLENWALLFDCDAEISNIWNASVSEKKGDYLIASNNRYNHDVLPGESTVFGFTASGDVCYPTEFMNVSAEEYVDADDYELSCEVTGHYGSDYYLNVNIANISDSAIENWKLDFEYPCEITSIWNAAELDEDGESHLIGYAENAFIDAGQSISFGMICSSETEDISDLFDCCEMTQVTRYSMSELNIPYREDVTDEMGNVYHFVWDSDSDEMPQVSAYTDIPFDEMLDSSMFASVSTMGILNIELPELNGYATVETEFSDEPDFVLIVCPEEQELDAVPYSSDGTRCTFRLKESAILVPVKVIPQTTAAVTTTTIQTTAATTTAAQTTVASAATTTAAQTTVSSAATTTAAQTTVSSAATTTAVQTTVASAATTTAAVQLRAERSYRADGDDALPMRGTGSSYRKHFNILSNSNGTIEVDLSDMRKSVNDKILGTTNGMYVKVSETNDVSKKGSSETKITLNANDHFTCSRSTAGLIYVRVYFSRKVGWDTCCWKQSVYVHPNPTLAESEQQELLRKYAPITVYNENESYAPMTIDEIFDEITDKTNVSDYKFSTYFGDETIDIDDMLTYMAYNGTCEDPISWNNSIANSQWLTGSSFSNIHGSFSDASVYSYYQEDSQYIYLNYYYFYAYDKKTDIGTANHNLDRESTYVVLNRDTKEPVYVVVGGHLPDTDIKYLNNSGKKVADLSWTNEQIKVPYEQMISDCSDGHPIVYIEYGQHCVMPFSGKFNTGIKNEAGLTCSILEHQTGIWDTSKLKAIFPPSYQGDGIKRYSMPTLPMEELYGDNPLNYSSSWVDVMGTTNAWFPPFIDRDYNKTSKMAGLSELDIDSHHGSLSSISLDTEDAFGRMYLFTLQTVENVTISSRSTGYNTTKTLTWDAVPGAEGYEILRTNTSGGTKTTFTSTGTTYSDSTASPSGSYRYEVRAYRTGIRYHDTTVYTDYTTASTASNSGTVQIDVRDADTNLVLSGVEISLDGNVVGKTNGQLYLLSVSSGKTHVISTHKEGYLDVTYSGVTVNTDETISLETLMQVPFNANAPKGTADLIIKNALTNNPLGNTSFVIRKGMNTTTGEILRTETTDTNGKVTLTEMLAGNYTALIEKNGYIKTIFNFTVIGGKGKSYEVHVSPVLDASSFRIVLSWGADPRDLDSHVSGNNVHVYYGSKYATGIQLDVDDTNGYGPETVTIDTETAAKGVYQYYVHRYAGSGSIQSSGAIIKVYCGSEQIRTYYANSAPSGDIWNVFKINTETGQIID